jgi:hypothetical protein
MKYKKGFTRLLKYSLAVMRIKKNYFMWPTVSFPFIICPIFKPNCQDFK